MNTKNEQLEYDAIYSAAGICLLEDRLIVRVSGEDRISFMHGMCTADIKNLSPGDVTRALFLTERAHVIADCFIYGLDEPALWIEADRARWPAIREHLERFLVADDVELDELDTLGALAIEGPASIAVVAAVFGDKAHELNPWRHLTIETLRIASLPRYGRPACTIIAERNSLVPLVEQLKKLRTDICELRPETLETLRIESGLARIGTDTNERTLALEARLEPAIAFNKGCYVGQETVERATAHGSLKRRLCGLRVTGREMPTTGASISLAGKEVGYLTSVARSPQAGIIALAILHHSAWAAGTCVCASSGDGALDAVVSELPFVPSHPAFTNEDTTRRL